MQDLQNREEAEKALKAFSKAWFDLLEAYSDNGPVLDKDGNELHLNEDYPFSEAMEDMNVGKWVKTQIDLLGKN